MLEWQRFAVLVLASLWVGTAKAEPPQKWFYAYVDLELEKGNETNYGTKQFLDLLPVLKCQGYDAIVLSCYQFGDLPSLADEENLIRKNLDSIVELAFKEGIKIIPEVMPVGPSESILQNDYSLAEGKQVKRQVLVLQDAGDNVTLGLPQPRNSIVMGDFWGSVEQLEANWSFDGECVNQLIADTTVALELKLTKSPSFPNKTRVDVGQEHLRRTPHHQYRLTFRMKTDGVVDNEFYARVSGKIAGKWYKLEEVNHKFCATQPWTEYAVLFNSYECDEYKFWFGFNKVKEGTAWITDTKISPALGPNLLRRGNDPDTGADEGLPVCVVDLTEQRELEEGTDYEVWTDPCVKGDGFSHARADTPIRFKTDRIDPGHVYAVSYYHAVLQSERDNHVCCSLRHPQVLDLFRQQIELLNAAISPERWLINHDEIRAMGHDPLANGDKPATILKDNLEACFEIIETYAPGSQPIVFNGMYDPNHLGGGKDHVGSRYPMVNGDFLGSSEVLRGSDGQGRALILNWQTGESDMEVEANVKSWEESLEHFNGINCPQVINAFYDIVDGDSDAAMEEFVRKRTDQIFQSARAKGIMPKAVCYYTTKRNTCYTALFAEVAKEVFGE